MQLVPLGTKFLAESQLVQTVVSVQRVQPVRVILQSWQEVMELELLKNSVY